MITMKPFETIKCFFFHPKKKDWDKIVNPTEADTFLINVQLGNNQGKVIWTFYWVIWIQIKERSEAEM